MSTRIHTDQEHYNMLIESLSRIVLHNIVEAKDTKKEKTPASKQETEQNGTEDALKIKDNNIKKTYDDKKKAASEDKGGPMFSGNVYANIAIEIFRYFQNLNGGEPHLIAPSSEWELSDEDMETFSPDFGDISREAAQNYANAKDMMFDATLKSVQFREHSLAQEKAKDFISANIDKQMSYIIKNAFKWYEMYINNFANKNKEEQRKGARALLEAIARVASKAVYNLKLKCYDRYADRNEIFGDFQEFERSSFKRKPKFGYNADDYDSGLTSAEFNEYLSSSEDACDSVLKGGKSGAWAFSEDEIMAAKAYKNGFLVSRGEEPMFKDVKPKMPSKKGKLREMVKASLVKSMKSMDESSRVKFFTRLLKEAEEHGYFDAIANKETEKKRTSSKKKNKQSQTILNKPAVNASELARRCPSLDDMSDDGRRSFISKIKNGEAVPSDKLDSEINYAYTNMFAIN